MKTSFANVASIVAIVMYLSTANAQESGRRSGSRNRVTVPASEVVNGDYFAFGETVEIFGTINGDLYASGGQVVVDGTVNGDVLVRRRAGGAGSVGCPSWRARRRGRQY